MMNYKTQYKIISKLTDYDPNNLDAGAGESKIEGSINDKNEKNSQHAKKIAELIELNQVKYEEINENDISHFPPYQAFFNGL